MQSEYLVLHFALRISAAAVKIVLEVPVDLFLGIFFRNLVPEYGVFIKRNKPAYNSRA
jgi:hypothetical protein